MVRGYIADREDCKECVANIGGKCKTLRETYWLKPQYECPFLATKTRLEKDAELLRKAIEEGRVDPEKYGGA